MLNYEKLKDKPRAFLAATGLTLAEFLTLLPAFQRAYAKRYPSDRTREGQPRQRRAGGGAKGGLQSYPDKLLFILVYQKTHPLQTMHARHFALSQPQAHYGMHHVLPMGQQARADVGLKPERAARRVHTSPLAQAGTPALALDGTARRRQRPTDPVKHQEPYSGKKKTPTDKNLLLVTETTGKVVSLGPTEPGKTHDKQAADQAQIASPVNATLDTDTGFHGDELAGILTAQPKESRKARP